RPQLRTAGGARRDEVERAVELGELARARAARSGIDVLDQDRARRGAVALPQLGAVNTIVGLEVEGRADRRQAVGGAAVAGSLADGGIDVLDHHRAGRGPVALP